MVWFLSGKSSDVRIGVTEAGSIQIVGDGVHDYIIPSGSSVTMPNQVRDAPANWSVHCSDAPEIDIDGCGTGLYERVAASPNSTHGSIHFFSERPALLGVSMILPPKKFSSTLQLFRDVMAHPHLGYRFTLDFLGFRVPGAEVDVPTAEEFLGGRIYFVEAVSVVTSWRKKNEAEQNNGADAVTRKHVSLASFRRAAHRRR